MNYTRFLNQDLDNLEADVQSYFNELLSKQDEFIIFAEEDLEHDTPDDYLEVRNDITGSVFDVHPLKVTREGIVSVTADGEFNKYTCLLSDLSSVQDRINLCELMENLLN
jgi:hypothetical protein